MQSAIWLTTTKLEDRLSREGRSPWGVRHAKREGAGHTLCGMPALNWKLFWHLPFQPTDRDACPSCRDSIAYVKAGEKPRRAVAVHRTLPPRP
jgi:hypothetical protein